MLNDIRLQNFRSYSDASFEFSPSVNIIVGPNASGKTNLLEAILFVSRGKSYRAKDSDLIKFKESWSRLDVRLIGGATRTIKLNSEVSPSKLYELNTKQHKRLGSNQRLPVVLFEPNHLRLLSGSPERRRDYLDDLLEQTLSGYDKVRKQYSRALAQRNALLKQPINNDRVEIFPWNIRLSELSGQIVKARTNLIEAFNANVPELYKELSKSNIETRLEYINILPVESYESRLLKELENSLENDKLQGFTTKGPHRDDLVVLFDKKNAQLVASRGETRTILLAIKIVEAKLLEIATNTKPIILLDDVFSELDSERRRSLTNHLAPYQTFITTTDADIAAKHFKVDTNTIAVV